MNRKKLVSTAVASALVAAQMVMPVMAADGGEVDVDVTTKTAVIRVQVPTALAVAVNQFEKGDTGSQIFSDAFDITNKSEIPVKVSVTSTATVGSGVTLLSTRKAAEDSEDAEAWLAVAAMTEAGKYIEAGKTIGDLTEAGDNVATFEQDSADATKAKTEQAFYLAAEETPTVTYTKVAPTDADTLAAAKKISYAQFYELTSIATQPTDNDTLQAQVDAADVYAIDGSDAVTFIAKGTIGATYAAGNTYYTAAADPIKAADLAQNKVYVYGQAGTAAAGGVAGFRYVGRLSEGKEVWDDNDISHINIKYDIAGVTGTKYDDVKADCVYGLYAEEKGPQAVLSASGLITVTGLDAGDTKVTVTGVTVMADGVNETALNSKSSTWNVTDAEAKIQLSTAWVELLDGKEATVTINLSAGDPIVITGTIAK